MAHTKKITLALVALSAVAMLGWNAQDERKSPQMDIGRMFTGSLEQAEGCYGVELAGTQSGKSCIFAFFENKKAVQDWYRSPMHMQFVGAMTKDVEGFEHKPLQHVADDAGPIMVVATMTVSDKPEIDGLPMPLSQISIELYTPLPGGAFINARLAPEGFEVEHMQDYTTPE